MTALPIRPFHQALQHHRERLCAGAAGGRKVLGYFCTYTPVEMIHAAGFVPIRIQGGVTTIERADLLAPGFLCPYLRQSLEKALRGEYDFLSGVVQGYTCDAACGMINVWELNFPRELYHTVPLPYLDGPDARTFLRKALGELGEKLNGIGGQLSDESLAASLDLYEDIRSRVMDLYEQRRRGRVPLRAAEFLSVIQAGFVTPPEDYLAMLRDLADAAGTVPETEEQGVPVMVSGSVLDDPRVLEILESCGGRVVGDDLCTGRRTFVPPAGGGDDSVDRLMDRHFRRFPCPARMKAQERAPLVAGLAETFGARGVIFLMQKFCSPHLADLPVVLEDLAARGVKGLVLELEETALNEGQMRTRLESFFEMLGA